MGKEERAPFEERAKREKANGCADSGAARGQATTDGGNHDNYHERYTSQGISFSELDRQKMNEERREKYIETRIVEFVKGLSYPKGLLSYSAYSLFCFSISIDAFGFLLDVPNFSFFFGYG